MEVRVRTENSVLKFNAAELDVARLVASFLGFELDAQAHDGGAKVTARKGTASISASGTSLTDAAKNIINLLAAT